MIYDPIYLSIDNPDSRYHYMYQRIVNRVMTLFMVFLTLMQIHVTGSWNLFGYFMLGAAIGGMLVLFFLFLLETLFKPLIEIFVDWITGY